MFDAMGLRSESALVKEKGRQSVAARAKGRLTKAIVLLALVAIVAAAGTVGFGLYLKGISDTILPHVVIGGVDVGGLTVEEARGRVGDRLESWIHRPVQMQLGTQTWDVLPQDLGVRLQLDTMLARAHAVGNSGSVVQRVFERMRVARQGVWGVPIMLEVNGGALDAWLDGIDAQYERAAQAAHFEVRAGHVVIIPSITGHRLDRTDVSRRIQEAVVRKEGRAVRLTLAEVTPALTTDDAYEMGIEQEIASYTTHFDPTNHNRTENIRIAAETLNGLLLAPGEEFSFNKRIGPRIASLGYKEAPVVVDGELVPDIGGGICQVSSTLYNAVLMADLRVTHRVPHSLPSTYVPLGRDATVAYDYIDFRFKNDGENHVLILAGINDDQVTISFWGDAPVNPMVRLESQIVGTIKPESVETPSKLVQAGTRFVAREGRDGYRVQVWRIAETQGGRVERRLVSQSVYKPRDRVIWVPSEQG